MTINELKEIALHAAKGTAPENFSVENVNEAFVDGLRELAGNYNQFMKNRYDIYDIIIETVDKIVPKEVIDALGRFAEVKTVAQGDKAMFKQRVGKNRAKKFLTQVGLSGVYETFRLDTITFEVAAHAIGGGATIDFERMLDGAEDLAECVEIIRDGLVNAVFIEVQRALHASFTNTARPDNNKYSGSWNADEMVKLMGVVRAYGEPIIFAPPEFIAAMGADAIVPVPVSGNYGGVYSPKDIEAIHDTGYIKVFRGATVVEIPQSFVDESNEEVWIDPQMAYILPASGEKVVKVVLEGATQIRDHENKDNSMEVYAWKKMGCAILAHYNWAIYKNTGITSATLGYKWNDGVYGI